MVKAKKAKTQTTTKKAAKQSAAPQNEEWLLIDVKGKVLGRAASHIAGLLRGKHTPRFVPYLDKGAFVIVINAGDIKLTGNKWDRKVYYHHTGYPGGIKAATASEVHVKKPGDLLRRAVQGMLPKESSLSRQLMTKLKIYAGADHPHSAQQPQAVAV